MFVADDVDAAWDEIGPYLLRNAVDYAAWNHGSTTTASLSTATTIDELRADEGAYRIVTVDEARTMAAEGSLNLHPMCGGIPPEVAWPYLRRVADEVARRSRSPFSARKCRDVGLFRAEFVLGTEEHGHGALPCRVRRPDGPRGGDEPPGRSPRGWPGDGRRAR